MATEWIPCEPCVVCGFGHDEGVILRVCSECGDPYCAEHQAEHEASSACWQSVVVKPLYRAALRLVER